ncbi:MAG: carbon storage regulator [Lachnospiraceae bacterium]|nr:carbon storage regulator [Lachnospiraceae bacterium]
MLRLTVSAEEYLMIGDDIKIVFLGGTKNHQRIMIDAPKDVNIARSKAMANRLDDPEEIAKMPQYYAEPEHPEKYFREQYLPKELAGKKLKGNIVITKGNLEER